MAIARKPTVSSTPQVDDAKAEAFINGAPDAKPTKPTKRTTARVYKKRKIPISFTVEEEVLEAFDKKVAELGLSRAKVFELAMLHYVGKPVPKLY